MKHRTTLARALALLSVAGWSALHQAPAVAVEGPWESKPEVAVRLVTAHARAAVNEPFRAGVEFRLAEGWHAYWKNSGDAGFAPVFDFAKTPELISPRVLWPAPQRFEAPGDLFSFGYERSVVYPLAGGLELPANAAHFELRVEIDFLVCKVECIPYRMALAVPQPVGSVPVPDEINALLIDAWTDRVPRPLDAATRDPEAVVAHFNRGEPMGFTLRLHVPDDGAGDAGRTRGNAELYLEASELFDFGVPEARGEDSGPFVFFVHATERDATRALPASFEVAWVLVISADSEAWEGRTTVDLGSARRSKKSAGPAFWIAIAVAISTGLFGALRAARGTPAKPAGS